jgi:hypothetical protein
MTDVSPGYTIIRLDRDPIYSEEDRYTVKRVMWSEVDTAAEVARLNEVNADTAATSGSTHAWINARWSSRPPLGRGVISPTARETRR